MNITLSDDTIVEILNVNIASGQVDWRRVEGEYTGACVSYGTFENFATIEADITAVIEGDING